MEFCVDRPIYMQIGTDIKEQILSGRLRAGDKLLSVREYSMFYEVSPLTIQRAMQYLEQEKVICSQRGVGNFVRDRAREQLEDGMIGQEIKSFVERLRKRGLSGSEILEMVGREVKRGGRDDD